MKKLFLIVLFTLSTYATIEESIDEYEILEKSKEKTIASSIKPQSRNVTNLKKCYKIYSWNHFKRYNEI